MVIEELITLLQEIQRSSPRAVVMVPACYEMDGYYPLDKTDLVIGRVVERPYPKRAEDVGVYDSADPTTPGTLSAVFLKI